MILYMTLIVKGLGSVFDCEFKLKIKLRLSLHNLEFNVTVKQLIWWFKLKINYRK